MKSSAEVEKWRGQFGGCDCSLGLSVCSCTTACEKAEPSRYDNDSLPLLRWLGVAIALIVVSIIFAVVVPLLRSQS